MFLENLFVCLHVIPITVVVAIPSQRCSLKYMGQY